jgi:aspartate aminotransferase
MAGNKVFNELSVKLAYGDDHQVIKDKRVAAVQTLSGTG